VTRREAKPHIEKIRFLNSFDKASSEKSKTAPFGCTKKTTMPSLPDDYFSYRSELKIAYKHLN